MKRKKIPKNPHKYYFLNRVRKEDKCGVVCSKFLLSTVIVLIFYELTRWSAKRESTN
jgi:hypothetical protein